jgi:hypothetical protein
VPSTAPLAGCQRQRAASCEANPTRKYWIKVIGHVWWSGVRLGGLGLRHKPSAVVVEGCWVSTLFPQTWALVGLVEQQAAPRTSSLWQTVTTGIW